MELFRVFGSVFLKDEEAQKGLERIDKKAENAGDKLDKMAKTAAKWGAIFATGATAAGTSIFVLANKTAQTTDRIDKLSQKIGLSRQGFQEWDFILSQSGTSIENMQMGMKTLALRLDELNNGTGKGAENFAQLGITLDEIKGKSQEEIFEKVVTQLQLVEDETQKAILANEMFGRAGQELMPLLNQSAGSVEELKNKAHELGLVLNDETIDAGVQWTDTLDQLKRAVGALFSGLGGELLPKIQEWGNWIIENMPTIKERANTAISFITTLFEGLVQVIGFLIENSNWLIPVLSGVLASIVAFKIISTINALIAAWKASTIAMTYAQGGLNAVLAANPIGIVILAIGALVAAGVALYKNWDVVKEKLEGFWRAIKDIFGKIKEFVLGVWDAIGNGIKWYINSVIRGMNVLIGALNKISFKVPDWVPKIGGKGFSFNIPKIPMLAEGGNITKSGMAIVGERGPEVVNLPAGASVTPLDKAKGITVNINNPKLFNERDADKLGDLVVRRLRTIGVN